MGETGEGMEWDILKLKCDSGGFEKVTARREGGGGGAVTEEDSDDLRREVQILKAFKKDKFDDKLEIYLNNVCSGYKKMKGSKEVDSIDKVWTPILLSVEKES